MNEILSKIEYNKNKIYEKKAKFINFLCELIKNSIVFFTIRLGRKLQSRVSTEKRNIEI